MGGHAALRGAGSSGGPLSGGALCPPPFAFGLHQGPALSLSPGCEMAKEVPGLSHPFSMAPGEEWPLLPPRGHRFFQKVLQESSWARGSFQGTCRDADLPSMAGLCNQGPQIHLKMCVRVCACERGGCACVCAHERSGCACVCSYAGRVCTCVPVSGAGVRVCARERAGCACVCS